jgi:hypothetical protein
VSSPWRRMYSFTQSLVSAEQLIDAAIIAPRVVDAEHATATLYKDPCITVIDLFEFFNAFVRSLSLIWSRRAPFGEFRRFESEG